MKALDVRAKKALETQLSQIRARIAIGLAVAITAPRRPASQAVTGESRMPIGLCRRTPGPEAEAQTAMEQWPLRAALGHAEPGARRKKRRIRNPLTAVDKALMKAPGRLHGRRRRRAARSGLQPVAALDDPLKRLINLESLPAARKQPSRPRLASRSPASGPDGRRHPSGHPGAPASGQCPENSVCSSQIKAERLTQS